ncbi:ferritin-like domain-containing protein [Lacticaseibacillus camelliae]|uniref:Stress induced DNA binding protein n=1 Tax=Lacticaseibacillus camelliae DSM 22697 = JCM 13995 TaxID=1423730 RepID=A0A0R2EPF8_9LACO|nr:ferritin-like domain-containing protein [Lacticaseibacillus camelliae]KRN18174.1 stress induced DNA binding protein [Lacticaseibacillus camelliae DSM 22697 = JCM 13995]
MTIDEQYEAEVKQADLDHHKPTAGAMTGHIVANLFVMNVKMHQVAWYVKGEQSLAVADFYQQLIAQNRQQIDEIGEVLLDEDQIVPSTTGEFAKYTGLQEDGRLKYDTAANMVAQTAKDFTTEDMYIDRAIKLAEREERPAMAAYLTKLRGENNQAVRKLQSFLGKTAWEDLVEVDDDDDDED